MLRLGQRKDEDEWAATWDRLSEGLPEEPSLLKSGLELDDFGMGPSLATNLLEMVLGAAGAPVDNSMSENIDWIEVAGTNRANSIRVLLPTHASCRRSTEALFFRGFTSSVSTCSTGWLPYELPETFASSSVREERVRQLIFVVGMRISWLPKKGTGGAAALCEDATAVSTLGIPARRRSIVSLWNHPGTYKDRNRRILLQCGRAMLPRMDSRLSHRRVLNEHSVNLLLDPMLEEQTLRSLVKASASTDYEQHFELARFVGDRETLESLLRSEKVPGKTRFQSVQTLAELGMTDEESGQWLEQLIADDPDQWEVVGPIAYYLEDQESK